MEAAAADLTGAKAALRRSILARRRALGAPYRQTASVSIWTQILAMPEFVRSRSVAAFYPMATEVNIRPLLLECWAQNKTLALPRVADQSKRQLTFHRHRDGDPLRPGYGGIDEPAATAPEISDFDFLLVPAVAIDAQNFRLGYGGGFYDRVLARHPAVFSCAAVFLCQRVQKIPCETHDQSVRITVSETTQ